MVFIISLHHFPWDLHIVRNNAFLCVESTSSLAGFTRPCSVPRLHLSQPHFPSLVVVFLLLLVAQHILLVVQFFHLQDIQRICALICDTCNTSRHYLYHYHYLYHAGMTFPLSCYLLFLTVLRSLSYCHLHDY